MTARERVLGISIGWFIGNVLGRVAGRPFDDEESDALFGGVIGAALATAVIALAERQERKARA